MRIHIELDEDVLSLVMELGSFSTKEHAVNTALRHYANRLKRDRLLQSQGKVPWQGDLERLRVRR